MGAAEALCDFAYGRNVLFCCCQRYLGADSIAVTGITLNWRFKAQNVPNPQRKKSAISVRIAAMWFEELMGFATPGISKG